MCTANGCPYPLQPFQIHQTHSDVPGTYAVENLMPRLCARASVRLMTSLFLQRCSRSFFEPLALPPGLRCSITITEATSEEAYSAIAAAAILERFSLWFSMNLSSLSVLHFDAECAALRSFSILFSRSSSPLALQFARLLEDRFSDSFPKDTP